MESKEGPGLNSKEHLHLRDEKSIEKAEEEKPER